MCNLCSFYPPELLVWPASFVDSTAQKIAGFAARPSKKASSGVHTSGRQILIRPCKVFGETYHHGRKMGLANLKAYQHCLENQVWFGRIAGIWSIQDCISR
jgi:hypothetical protein